MQQNLGKFIAGIMLILIGTSIFLDNFGLAHVTRYIWNLWPLILVYFGLKNLSKGENFWGSFLLLLGMLFLVNNYFVLNLNIFAIFWPVLIIFIGLMIIFKAMVPKSLTTIGMQQKDTKDNVSKMQSINEVTIFSENKKQYATDDFKGGTVVTIFGDTKIDLTKSKINDKNAVLDVVCVFGNVDLYVADEMNLKIDAVPILGGINDQRRNVDNNAEQGTLQVKAVAIFGAFQAKNPKN